MVLRIAGSTGVSGTDRRTGLAGTFVLVLCCALPVVIATQLFVSMVKSDDYAVDFRSSYWSSARDGLHGHSPLPPPDSKAPLHGTAYPAGPYPPAVAVFFTPLALLPKELASFVFTALPVLAIFAALRILDVREWRCYAVVFAWAPVFSGLQSGNLTLLLLPALAATWRFRDLARVVIPVAGTALTRHSPSFGSWEFRMSGLTRRPQPSTLPP